MTQHATYPQPRPRTLDDPPAHDHARDAPVTAAPAPDARVGAPAGAAGVQTAGMHKALTDEHSRPGRVSTAGAAPVTAGAIPAATPAAPGAPQSAPPVRGLGGPRVPGEGRAGASTAPAGQRAAEAAPAAREATTAAEETHQATGGRGAGRVSAGVSRALAFVALLGMLPVAGVGFAASYENLRQAAEAKGFSHDLSYWVPVAIDGAILAFLALDIYMTSRRIGWPILRFAAHGMVVVTIVFNATGSRVGDPVAMAWHGLMPVLFVIGVEAVRKLILHATRLARGEVTDRIPLHRWMLAPAPTARLYRRMRLANVTSYDEMVKREQALNGYRVWLTQELGGDLSKATEVQRLPMTLAPKGFTVDEALALPAQWETEAAERARDEAERAALGEAEAAERAAELEITKLKSAGRVEAARHQVQAETGTAAADADAVTAEAKARAESARARAESLRAQAELAATAETEAFQSREAAAMLRQAAEDKLRAETATAEAEAERRRAQAERTEAERLEAEAAEQHRRKLAVAAEAERANADAETERLRAVEARRRIAVLEAEAATADAWAGLNPRQIKARKVARMIVAAGGNADHVDVVGLKEIEAAVGVGQTVAGEIRKEAQHLLAGGYDPASAYQPQNWA